MTFFHTCDSVGVVNAVKQERCESDAVYYDTFVTLGRGQLDQAPD